MCGTFLPFAATARLPASLFGYRTRSRDSGPSWQEQGSGADFGKQPFLPDTSGREFTTSGMLTFVVAIWNGAKMMLTACKICSALFQQRTEHDASALGD